MTRWIPICKVTALQGYGLALAIALAISGAFVVDVADAAFTGRVCSLLTARQVAAVNVAPKCMTVPPVVGKGRAAGFNHYDGVWDEESSDHIDLQLTSIPAADLASVKQAFVRTRPSYYAKAKGGIPVRLVPGMPLADYQHWHTSSGTAGSTGTAVVFLAHGYECALDLEYAYDGGTPTPSKAAAFRLAKLVAREL